MARAGLALGVRDLAKLAGVSPMTVTRFETGKSRGYADTIDRLQRALEAAGVEFTEDGGVRLKPDPTKRPE